MLESLKSPLVVTGRVLLALMFVMAGVSKLGNVGGTAAYIASGGLPAPTALAVLVGLFEVIAGVALAVGLRARWAALALGLFTLLASVLFHAFWSMPVDQQMVQVMGKYLKKPAHQMTIGQFWRGIGRLGGHLGRTRDGPVGWLRAWRGWQAFQLILLGARLAEENVGNC